MCAPLPARLLGYQATRLPALMAVDTRGASSILVNYLILIVLLLILWVVYYSVSPVYVDVVIFVVCGRRITLTSFLGIEMLREVLLVNETQSWN